MRDPVSFDALDCALCGHPGLTHSTPERAEPCTRPGGDA